MLIDVKLLLIFDLRSFDIFTVSVLYLVTLLHDSNYTESEDKVRFPLN